MKATVLTGSSSFPSLFYSYQRSMTDCSSISGSAAPIFPYLFQGFYHSANVLANSSSFPRFLCLLILCNRLQVYLRMVLYLLPLAYCNVSKIQLA
jgi:hypothetical protein